MLLLLMKLQSRAKRNCFYVPRMQNGFLKGGRSPGVGVASAIPKIPPLEQVTPTPAPASVIPQEMPFWTFKSLKC